MLLYPPPSLCILALVGRVWEKIQATTGLIFFSCPCSGIHEGDFILLNLMGTTPVPAAIILTSRRLFIKKPLQFFTESVT